MALDGGIFSNHMASKLREEGYCNTCIQLREQVRVLELDAIDRDEVNRGLREQLEVEQINHRQTIDTYSDEVAELKEKLAEAETKVEAYEKELSIIKESRGMIVQKYLEAKTKVAKMQKVLNDIKKASLYVRIPTDETTPVQFVGAYVAKWGQSDKPTEGFYEFDASAVEEALE